MGRVEQIAAVLGQTAIFRGLAEAQLLTVAQLGVYEKIPRGGYLIEQDADSDLVFVLLQGQVAVQVKIKDTDKHEIVAKLGPGNVFGELALLNATKRTASIQAADDVGVLLYQAEKLRKLVEADRNIGFVVMKNLAVVLAKRVVATTKTLSSKMQQFMHQPMNNLTF